MKTQKPDPSHNIWRQRANPLEVIFKPKSVAVIGATEKPGSVGRTLLENLKNHFSKGKVYPVNPHHERVLGLKAYPSVGDVPETELDLAVIVTPARTVPEIVGECASRGVRGAIIISAGFKELGKPGEELESQILKQCAGKMRLIGPNCLGVMNPLAGFNATFANRMAKPGSVGFLSQSGALCTAILDWSFKGNVGFSAFVSVGSMLDVGWGDLINYLANDEATKSILIYMETVGDTRSFLSAAREVALTKPIIVLKAGRTAAAAKAAASHTGSIAGSDEVLDAAFDRCGVLRVNQIEELFEMADVLSKQPRPKGPRLAFLTNAGGPGVLATDALIREGGLLSELSGETLKALNSVLPDHWSHGNPVDILGDADPDRFAKTVSIISKDASSDGILVILTPQAMTDPTKTAEVLAGFAKLEGKPILACWMGDTEVERGRAILKEAGIPVFAYPDQAVRIFSAMWKYNHNLELLYETPALPSSYEEKNEKVSRFCRNLLDRAQRRGRVFLTEIESKQILSHYGIPVVDTRLARSRSEAVRLAQRIGYPVVLKLHSETLTHKTDVGGVKLNLSSKEEVGKAFDSIASSVTKLKGKRHFSGVTVQPMVREEGYELIFGSSIDPQFGPVILFGSGGQLVELYEDHALALPPLNTTLARRLLEKTRISKALRGVRGRAAVSVGKLEELLVIFSRLVVEQSAIREIDINPILASPSGFVALDARIILNQGKTLKEKVSRPAIRPYPSEYAVSLKIKGGMAVTIRPIRPEDEPLMVKFHYTLSEESVRRRYLKAFGLNERIAHDRMVKVCFNDFDREIALVVDFRDPKTKQHEILGAARLSRGPQQTAEFTIVISDRHQNRGLGKILLKRLIEVARCEGIQMITAEIFPDNLPVQRLCKKFGFAFFPSSQGSKILARLDL